MVKRNAGYALIFSCLLFVNVIHGLTAQNVRQPTVRDTSDQVPMSDTSGITVKSLNLSNNSLARDSAGKPAMIFRNDTLLRSPWGAVGRSLIIPGWGQLYNDQPLKAAVFLASDVSWIMLYKKRDVSVRRIEKQRKIIDRQLRTDPYLNQEQRRILQLRFSNLTVQLDQALNNRNIYGWLFALSHLLGMVDAFVDAHLYGFNEKMDMALTPARDGTGITLSVTFK